MTVAEILTEMEGHFAYDIGSTASGVHDFDRLKVLRNELQAARTADTFRQDEAIWFRETYLSDSAIASGSGFEDALQFAKWLEK